VLGYSPLEAGLALFPVTILMLTLSSRAGAMAARIGPRLPLTAGPVLAGIGLLALSRVDAGSHWLTAVLPGAVLFGLGLSLTVAPLTTSVLAAVEDRHAGVASGVNNAVARTGQLLAVAAVPLVAGFVPGASVAVDDLIDGFHRVMRVAAGTAVVAAVVAWLTVRRPPTLAEPNWACAVGGPPPVPEPVS
jgi:MFS family permease